MNIYLAQLNYTVGALVSNRDKIVTALDHAAQRGADLALFSELALSGYPPEDLLFDASYINTIEKLLDEVVQASPKGMMVVVGLPRYNPHKTGKPLHNSAAVIIDGKLVGFHDKVLLPTYDVFDERRYFEPGGEVQVFTFKGKKVAVLICEDLWAKSAQAYESLYERDPVLELQVKGVDLVLNLSASPYAFKRLDKRLEVAKRVAHELSVPLVYCNQVGANDQLIFDGYSFVLDKRGELLHLSAGFKESGEIILLQDQKPSILHRKEPLRDLHDALVLGIRDYFSKTKAAEKACLGLSGGVDSALVLALAVKALGSHNLLAINMPSQFSSDSGREDAKLLAKRLFVAFEEVPIEPLFDAFYKSLLPLFEGKSPDETEENLQARIRGTILMSVANKRGMILLNTGNKSEFALGYSTLYGDMCGGLSVLGDLKKGQIYDLCRYINREQEIIPQRILERAPSAELKPNQTDQDLLPPYPLLDLIIEGYIEQGQSIDQIASSHHLDKAFIASIVHKIHLAEYKRRQAPPHLRVSDKSFSKGRVVPIVQQWY